MRRRALSIILMLLVFVTGVALILWSLLITPEPTNDLLIRSIGTVGEILLITGTLAVLNDLILRDVLLSDFGERVQSSMRDFFDERFGNSIKYGFSGIDDEIDFKSLIEGLVPDDTLQWLDTYAPGHAQWLDAIETRAQAGINFQFLVVKPGSMVANMRKEELGGRFLETFDKELDLFIEDIEAVANRVNQNGKQSIEIKYYDGLLAIPFYLVMRRGVPQYAKSSFYLKNATGLGSPHMKWDQASSGLIDSLSSYFDWKWQAATRSKV